jgi:hypothetical protein
VASGNLQTVKLTKGSVHTMSGASPESLFIAGCVGAAVPILLRWNATAYVRRRQAELCRSLLYIVLGGYVAACIWQPSSTIYAFAIGMVLDTTLATLRRVSLLTIEAKAKSYLNLGSAKATIQRDGQSQSYRAGVRDSQRSNKGLGHA